MDVTQSVFIVHNVHNVRVSLGRFSVQLDSGNVLLLTETVLDSLYVIFCAEYVVGVLVQRDAVC